MLLQSVDMLRIKESRMHGQWPEGEMCRMFFLAGTSSQSIIEKSTRRENTKNSSKVHVRHIARKKLDARY